jgi:hypothetical protein
LELRSIYLQSGQYVLDAYTNADFEPHPNTNRCSITNPNTDCKPYRGSESNTDPHVKSIRDADTNPCTHAVSHTNTNPIPNAKSIN